MDVSGCSHEEAVEVLTRASEPIMVQVRHRHSDTQSEVRSNQADTGDMTQRADSGSVAEKCSREIQTEPEPETICDHCGEFYGSYTNYNCDSLGPALGELGDSLIYPELQYEVSAMLPGPGCICVCQLRTFSYGCDCYRNLLFYSPFHGHQNMTSQSPGSE